MLVALVAPASAFAQGPARAPSACTYETCALRLESSYFGPPKLLRGRAGEEVGRLGLFGGNVDTLLAGPDSASAYARRYLTNTRRGTTLGLIGTVAAIAAIVSSDNYRDPDGTTVALALTGVGFAIAAIPFEVRATRSLSRAIWYYNSVLPTR
jgi:hypothetical protein